MALDGQIPSGPIAEKWDKHQFELKLVNPANKRKHTLIVVGTGLAGASAAATLAELGYNVLSFCLQDTPRRAHSIATTCAGRPTAAACARSASSAARSSGSAPGPLWREFSRVPAKWRVRQRFTSWWQWESRSTERQMSIQAASLLSM